VAKGMIDNQRLGVSSKLVEAGSPVRLPREWPFQRLDEEEPSSEKNLKGSGDMGLDSRQPAQPKQLQDILAEVIWLFLGTK